MNAATPFKWRHFEAEIILLCVRWYLRYALSYRDPEEMMRERGRPKDHPTIYRWVQHYAPELEKRCRPHLKVGNDSWKVDETSIKASQLKQSRQSCRDGTEDNGEGCLSTAETGVVMPILPRERAE